MAASASAVFVMILAFGPRLAAPGRLTPPRRRT